MSLPEDGPTKGGATSSVDPAAVVELLRRFKHLLESDDAEASDFIIEESPSLSEVLTDMEIEKLKKLAADFNFEEALKCLSSVVSRLQLDLQNK